MPIPHELALTLAGAVQQYGGDNTIVTDVRGRATTPWAIERAIRAASVTVDGLPAGFRFHDLRHYFASLLIANGCDVKIVQTRVRHANATTTLNTYGHMFPDNDETTRSAVSSAPCRHLCPSCVPALSRKVVCAVQSMFSVRCRSTSRVRRA